MIKRIILSLLFLSLFIFGCRKDSGLGSGQIDPAVQYTSDTFNDWYLWFESIPKVDLSSFKTPDDYINAIRYSKDRWSFTMPLDKLNALLSRGETTGWGAGIGFDQNNALRILYVYDNSPMGKAGVKRGWQIKSLNGAAINTMSDAIINQYLNLPALNYTFVKNDRSEVTIQLTKGDVIINSVLYSAIIESNTKKIAYFVFSDFLDSSFKELTSIFESYSNSGVKDIIIDLRYNGGGTLNCADTLVALLAGNPHKDKVYNTLTYNNKHVRNGYQCLIGLKPNSISVDNLIFITTSETASASELVISGLKPYLKIKLVGSKTHGKPVGMNVFNDTRDNLAIAPISFKNLNSQGYGDYYDGIPVDYPVADDRSKEWGDQSDDCLSAAINFISTGTFPIAGKEAGLQAGRILSKGSVNPLNDLYQTTGLPEIH
jgi:carboxyl-terminal processing protease